MRVTDKEIARGIYNIVLHVGRTRGDINGYVKSGLHVSTTRIDRITEQMIREGALISGSLFINAGDWSKSQYSRVITNLAAM